MNTHLTTDDANTAWKVLLNNVMLEGAAFAPRGRKTLELIGYQSKFDMAFPLVSVTARDMGYRFAAGEAAWIVSGKDDVATISQYSRQIKHFSDDGEKFFGAYGPKIIAQLDYVINTLANDHDSRQAVINIWRESPPKSKDIPCTLSAQWVIRDGKLHCIDTMRSSDAWLGWVYDSFNFTMLSAYILLELRRLHRMDLRLGSMTINAGSQHIYLKDADNVLKVRNSTTLSHPHIGADLYPSLEPAKYMDSGEELLLQLWKYANGDGALQMMRDLGE